jgi:SAM-dependent methyltransferase
MSAANGRNLDALVRLPPVLDACCGSRGFWFDKNDDRALFVDARDEDAVVPNGTRKDGTVWQGWTVKVHPDVQADFGNMPFPSDTFALVVMDPPHLENLRPTSRLRKQYGTLLPGWRDVLRAGFAECFRVLRPEGVLIFKWCEYEVPVREVLALTPHKPLFGHRSGKLGKTHWIAFLKPNNVIDGNASNQNTTTP